MIVAGLLYAALVLMAKASPEVALGTCLTVAVTLPVLLFRHARSLLLALDSTVNSRQAGSVVGGALTPAEDAVPASHELDALSDDDARAGCLMGAVVTRVIVFGLLMAGATLWFTGAFEGGASPDGAGGGVVRFFGPAPLSGLIFQVLDGRRDVR